MPSLTFELFRKAIDEKKQVVCLYHGLPREVCPHVIGYSMNGGEHVLVYQFAGRSSQGLPSGGEWRCLELAHVREAEIRFGDWHTGHKHTRPQKCVQRIVAQVSF